LDVPRPEPGSVLPCPLEYGPYQVPSLSAYISETKNIRKNKPEGTGE